MAFWIILGLIGVIGIVTIREYRYGNHDIHEGNYLDVLFRVWPTWLSGLFLFIAGWTIDRPSLDSDDIQYLQWSFFGLSALLIACHAALPGPKKSKRDD